MKVEVHLGSVLSPLFSSLCLKHCHVSSAVGSHGRTSMLMTLLLEECVRRLLAWKEAMEEKGLRVNAGKTKIMICGTGLDLLQSSGKFPWAVCHTDGGSVLWFNIAYLSDHCSVLMAKFHWHGALHYTHTSCTHGHVS